jgi:leader peptidase (prepilin peptidase) / N-methyltransferase
MTLAFPVIAAALAAGLAWPASALVAALTGWLGWGVLGSAVFAGFALAACYGLVLVAVQRGSLRNSVPFGPFLVAGCIGAALLASVPARG